MDLFDQYLLWLARIVLGLWALWGVLHAIDYPVTRILKWFQSYYIIVEFVWYRKRFDRWLAESKVARIADGKWENSQGDCHRE